MRSISSSFITKLLCGALKNWFLSRDLTLLNTANTTDLSNYVANGEWDLVQAKVERNVVFYSCCQEPYPDVTYHFVLRRRPLFYGMF